MVSILLSVVLGAYAFAVPAPFYIPFLGFALAGNGITEETKKFHKRSFIIILAMIGLAINGYGLSNYIKQIW